MGVHFIRTHQIGGGILVGCIVGDRLERGASACTIDEAKLQAATEAMLKNNLALANQRYLYKMFALKLI